MDEYQANHELALLYARISTEQYLEEYPNAANDSIMVRIKAEYTRAMNLYNGGTTPKK